MSLKSLGAICTVQPFTPHRKLGVLDFLYIVRCCAGRGVYGYRVSQAFLPVSIWMFSVTWCIGFIQQVPGFLSEGIDHL